MVWPLSHVDMSDLHAIHLQAVKKAANIVVVYYKLFDSLDLIFYTQK